MPFQTNSKSFYKFEFACAIFKSSIFKHFQSSGPVRLDLITLPDPDHGGFDHELGFGRPVTSPVGGSRWLSLERARPRSSRHLPQGEWASVPGY